MNYYVYTVQRQDLYNNVTRDLVAKDKPYEISDDEVVDSSKKFGVKITPYSTTTINLIKELNVDSLKDLKKELQSLTKSYKLSCRYSYNGKDYLILSPYKNRIGVWKDNDLIIHQIKPHHIENPTEHIYLGNSDSDNNSNEEFYNSNFVSTYFPKWKEILFNLRQQNLSFNKALFISFILTFNQFKTSTLTFEEAIKSPIYHNEVYSVYNCNNYYYSCREIGKVRCCTKEQFDYYIAPTYFGKNNFYTSDFFYSLLQPYEINFYFRTYICKFWQYLQN